MHVIVYRKFLPSPRIGRNLLPNSFALSLSKSISVVQYYPSLEFGIIIFLIKKQNLDFILILLPLTLSLSLYISEEGVRDSKESCGLLQPSFPFATHLSTIMGISSLPAPSEGVLSIIVINTILSITTLTSILRSILTLIRIHLPPSSSSQLEAVVSSSHRLRHLPIPLTIPFGSIDHHNDCDNDCDCSVCLARFEPESEVSRLPCGHFFHTRCFERWLECWKVTCPLCRTPLLLQDDDEDCSSSCPWS